MKQYTKISHPESEWSKRSYFKNQLENDANEKSKINFSKMLNRYNNHRLNLIQAGLARQFADYKKGTLNSKIENDLINAVSEGFDIDKPQIEELLTQALDKTIDEFVMINNSLNEEIGLNNLSSNINKKLNDFKNKKIKQDDLNAEIDKYISILKLFLASEATLVPASTAIAALQEVRNNPLGKTKHLISRIAQDNAASVFSAYITGIMSEELSDIEETIIQANDNIKKQATQKITNTLNKSAGQAIGSIGTKNVANRASSSIGAMSKVNMANINALPITITLPGGENQLSFNIDLTAKAKNSISNKSSYSLYSNYGQNIQSMKDPIYGNFVQGSTTFRKLILDGDRFMNNSFAENDSAYYQTLYYNALRRANTADEKTGYKDVMKAIVSSYADLIIAGSGVSLYGDNSLFGLLDVNQVLLVNGKAYNMMTLLESLKMSNGVFSNFISANFSPRGIQADDVIDRYADAHFASSLKASVLQNIIV